MTKEEEVYMLAKSSFLSVHIFKGSESIFHKGFKFSKVYNKDNGIEYRAYNTRSNSYKRLTKYELDKVFELGVRLASDYFSYKAYSKDIDKYLTAMKNTKMAFKTTEKYSKVIDRLTSERECIVKRNHNNAEIFA